MAQRDATWIGWRFVAFPVAVVLLFTALPTVFGVGLSFFETAGGGDYRFVGLQNYRFGLQDENLRHALRNTVIFAAINVPLTVLLAFPIAVALSASWFRGRTLMRVMYFLPSVISIVAIGLVWRWVLDPTQAGLLNTLLTGVANAPHGLGLTAEAANPDWPEWLGNSPWGLATITLVSTWRGLGFAVVLYLAAVGGVPQAHYDAAAVDGAGAWQTMWKITWPAVRPMTFFLLITGGINALQVFDVVYVMVGNVQQAWTDVLNLYLYREFERARVGYAAMIGVIVLAATAALTLAQLWWMWRSEKVSG